MLGNEGQKPQLLRLCLVFLIIAILLCAVTGLACELYAKHCISEAVAFSVKGEQWWPREVRRVLLAGESSTFFPSSYARQLAANNDPNVAAEGMLMVVRHPDGHSDQIIKNHLSDQSVNQYLYKNADFAALCLKLLDIKRRGPRNADENQLLTQWTSRALNLE